MAAVVLKKGVEMTENEVRDYCRDRIANYKITEICEIC